MMLGLCASVLLTVAAVMHCDAAVTCKDEAGKPVDWFIVYKLPRSSSSSTPQVREGYAYMYMDVHNTKLRLSDVWLNDTNHAISYTVQQIYQNRGSKDVAYVLYNDELPDSQKKVQTYGHTKGDLVFDATSGFWLVHSTPRFPSNASFSYNWPQNARTYGQSFLCVTYGYDQFEDIGKQLMYNHPYIYDSNLPSDLVEKTPSIVSVTNKRHVMSPPWNRSVSLTSVGGQTFTSFAKFIKFDQDIYFSWLAPYFDRDLYAETWQNNHGKLNSSCGGHKVNNVLSLNLIGGEAFTETKDHSKWALTSEKGSKWICIGDINRACSQMKRAGGTVCFENTDVHDVFLNAVTKIQECPQENICHPG